MPQCAFIKRARGQAVTRVEGVVLEIMRITALPITILSASIISLGGGQTAVGGQLNVITINNDLGIDRSGVSAQQQAADSLHNQPGIEELPAEQTVQAEAALPAPVIVTVARGDSLSAIAKAHGITVQRLYDANDGIQNPDIIHSGQQLRIPLADEVLAARAMPAAVTKPAVKPAAARTTARRVVTSAPAVTDGSIWDALARCESGGNWAINTGNGYYGGLQFTASTWRAVGGQGLPHQNSREEQILRGQILQQRSGWGQWPACTKKLGLR